MWGVSIWKVLASAPASVGELEFPGREPLVIEWAETSKEEVVCGSTATLRLLSPGDRTYTGLYTIEAGSTGVVISRNGALYWQGTLDPEFYEEPYTDMEDYEVELTFSDFGILDRKKYDLTGLVTLEAILQSAIAAAFPWRPPEVDETLISSSLPGVASALGLGDLSVRSDNFEDEDGEVKTLLEVTEGVLQPLGLRLVQRNGRVWVYDLNGLWESREETVVPVVWHDADQMLGVDKVANRVKVTFSPYGGSEVLGHTLKYLGAVDKSQTFIYRPGTGQWGSTLYTYYAGDPSEYTEGDADNYSFTIFTSNRSSDGVGASLGGGAFYFHTEPIYGGSAHDGIAWGFVMCFGDKGENYFYGHNLCDQQFGRAVTPYLSGQTVMKSYRVYIPRMSQAAASRYYLRLSLEVMFDGRYNPFEEGGSSNCGGDEDDLKHNSQLVRVPVSVRLWSAESGGVVTQHWANKYQFGARPEPVSLARLVGRWESGDYALSGSYTPSEWPAHLGWWDESDWDGSGCCGWQKNRQDLGYSYGNVSTAVRKLGEGQLMPYPEMGGWLEVEVLNDVEFFYWNGSGLEDKSVNCRELLRWQLYKAPQIALVWSDSREDVSVDDVERQGVLNAAAAEEVEIETICGTLEEAEPTAKGLYYVSGTGEALSGLVRGGHEDLPERLLIGTLYSQWAQRHVRLSGTAFQLTGGLEVYEDGASPDVRYMMLGDVQDADAGTSEVVLVELSGDEYVKSVE